MAPDENGFWVSNLLQWWWTSHYGPVPHSSRSKPFWHNHSSKRATRRVLKKPASFPQAILNSSQGQCLPIPWRSRRLWYAYRSDLRLKLFLSLRCRMHTIFWCKRVKVSLPRSATEGLKRWILPEILHPNGLLIGPVTWTLIYLFLIFCQHTPVNLVCRLNHHCYPVATQLLPKQILKLHHKSINHWTATLPGCYPERYSQFKPLLYMYSCNFHVVMDRLRALLAHNLGTEAPKLFALERFTVEIAPHFFCRAVFNQ